MKFNPIGFTEHFPSLKMTLAFGEVSLLKLIALTAGYGITIFAGSPIVFVVCRGFKVEEIKRGIKGAGKYIGYFERFLILTFVLLNQYSAIGLILAAKSIARFEELKKKEFAEYYLIGTFCSISMAVFIGLLLKFLFCLSFGVK